MYHQTQMQVSTDPEHRTLHSIFATSPQTEMSYYLFDRILPQQHQEIAQLVANMQYIDVIKFDPEHVEVSDLDFADCWDLRLYGKLLCMVTGANGYTCGWYEKGIGVNSMGDDTRRTYMFTTGSPTFADEVITRKQCTPGEMIAIMKRLQDSAIWSKGIIKDTYLLPFYQFMRHRALNLGNLSVMYNWLAIIHQQIRNISMFVGTIHRYDDSELIFAENVLEQVTNVDFITNEIRILWNGLEDRQLFDVLVLLAQRYSELTEGDGSIVDIPGLIVHQISTVFEEFLADVREVLPDQIADIVQQMFKNDKPPRFYDVDSHRYEVYDFEVYDEFSADKEENKDHSEDGETAYCDPGSTTQDCITCNPHDMYKINPQDRCLALCKSTHRQCNRRHQEDDDYCLQHMASAADQTFVKTFDLYDVDQIGIEVYSADPVQHPSITRYPATFRPINPMLRRIASSNQCQQGTLLLPVYRATGLYYSKGMQQDERFCGKFYFYEPQSPVMLDLGQSTRIFGSKVSACTVMYGELSQQHGVSRIRKELLPATTFRENANVDVELRFDPDKTLVEDAHSIKHYENLFGVDHVPLNLIILALAFAPLDRYMFVPDEDNGDRVTAAKNATVIQTYFGHVLENETDTKTGEADEAQLSALYPTINPTGLEAVIGQLDELDQIVCALAHALEIDTIILQHEVGKIDAVTEIIDIRTNSMQKHLYSIPRIASSKHHPAAAKRYPKIWTLSDGIYVADANNVAHNVEIESFNLRKGTFQLDSESLNLQKGTFQLD